MISNTSCGEALDLIVVIPPMSRLASPIKVPLYSLQYSSYCNKRVLILLKDVGGETILCHALGKAKCPEYEMS